jgi:hypothetical protein
LAIIKQWFLRYDVCEQRQESGFILTLIAVSSFGESLRRVILTAPAEAVFNPQ